MTHDNLPNDAPSRTATTAGGAALKRPAVFYGWWIVVASGLISLITNGFVLLGFTAFFEPIVAEFGWSYTQISLAASLRSVEVGLLAPVMGVLVDRFGPRKMVTIGIILVSAGLLFLSQISTLLMFYLAYFVIAIGTSFSSPVVLLTTTAYWFRKNLGMATGITVSGFALGGLLLPLVVKLIDMFSWQTAVIIIGGMTLIFGLPLSMILRHRPQQYGLLPDGEIAVVTDSSRVPVKIETGNEDFGIKQAVRSPAFWHIGLAMMFMFMAINAVTAHVMPYLSSIGIPRSTAGVMTMAIPLVSIIGRIGSGWLGDRLNRKGVATGLFALVFIGLICSSFASSEVTWLIFPFIVFFGIGWGGSTTARVALIREYFGSAKFGSIFGLCMGMAALGSVAGPLLAGWVFDTWASYRIAWAVLGILVFGGMFVIATTTKTGK